MLAYAIPGAKAEFVGVSDSKLVYGMFVTTCIAVAIAVGAVLMAYRARRQQPKPLPIRAGGPIGRAQAAGYACSPQIRTATDVALQRQLATADAERIARQAQRDADHDAWVDAALAETLADTGATGSTVSSITAELERSDADFRARTAFLASLESSNREADAARQTLRCRPCRQAATVQGIGGVQMRALSSTRLAAVPDDTQRMIRRQGYCGSCGMWGHWSRDCPHRQRRHSDPDAPDDDMEIDLVE